MLAWRRFSDRASPFFTEGWCRRRGMASSSQGRYSSTPDWTRQALLSRCGNIDRSRCSDGELKLCRRVGVSTIDQLMQRIRVKIGRLKRLCVESPEDFLHLYAEVHSLSSDYEDFHILVDELDKELARDYLVRSQMRSLEAMKESLASEAREFSSREDSIYSSLLSFETALNLLGRDLDSLTRRSASGEGDGVVIVDDGLPGYVVSEERLKALCRCVDVGMDDVVAEFFFKTKATLREVLFACAQAGCLPEYVPVVLAALRAMAEEGFMLLSVLTTEYPCWPLVLVNGPVMREIGMNWRGGSFGPGNRANSTIGRAVSRFLMRFFGARKLAQGAPTQYSYCSCENEEESPWGPMHVDRGFNRSESTVTVFAAEPPHAVTDHVSRSGEDLLTVFAKTIATPGKYSAYFGGEVLVVFGLDHARLLAEDGWGKSDIRRFIFENARIEKSLLRGRGEWGLDSGAQEWLDLFGDGPVPSVRSPEDVSVVASALKGRHSLVIPTFARSRSVTRRVG